MEVAAALSGATLGIHASPFSGTAGGPPKTGQFFLAIDPKAMGGDLFATRMGDLVAAIHGQEGAHLPGDGRKSKRVAAQSDGVAVNLATLKRIEEIIG